MIVVGLINILQMATAVAAVVIGCSDLAANLDFFSKLGFLVKMVTLCLSARRLLIIHTVSFKKTFLQQQSHADRARLLSVSSAHTSSRLLAVRSPGLGSSLGCRGNAGSYQMVAWHGHIFWVQMCSLSKQYP